jgi:hypothetical protein
MKSPAVPPESLALGGVAFSLVATALVGFALGFELAILVFAAAVLVGVIALFWLSVRNLSGDTPLSIDEALGLGAPTAAEEQKRAVLRALKDLEFERSVGKIGEEDYREFSARYRAEAKRLIAAVDESLGPVQELAETLVAERLARAGLGNPEKPAFTRVAEPRTAAEHETETAGEATEEGAPATPSEAESSSTQGDDQSAGESLACPSCSTENDPDARFCKRCGAAFETSRRPQPRSIAEEELP